MPRTGSTRTTRSRVRVRQDCAVPSSKPRRHPGVPPIPACIILARLVSEAPIGRRGEPIEDRYRIRRASPGSTVEAAPRDADPLRSVGEKVKAERWAQVRDVFERSLLADDVEAFLSRECGDDAELLASVQALRRADAAAEARSFDPPPLHDVHLGVDARLVPGDRIGMFEVVRELRRGGMGIVYEARQLEPQRLVALKVLDADAADPALAPRIAGEAQILARLRHPGIATIHAAGLHELPDGRRIAYLAMELVDDACDLVSFAVRDGLDTRMRLALFLQVCEAVHAAHQKGVIHRDLKPSNILVDADRRVRVIDFGIADLEGGSVAGDAVVAGTPRYMSPERLSGGDAGHDLRSDVYSLGVILEELCPGPERQLRWIAARARAAEAGDRYSSAADLAQDVERWLAREPVLAGPATLRYRAGCFVRRHALGVSAAVLVLVFLAAGLITATLGWREAARQGAQAQEEARRSGALRDVLRDLIGETSLQRQGPEVTLLAGLDRIIQDLEGTRSVQPDLQVVVLCDVARVQIEIGQWQRAAVLLERAVRIAERHVPDSAELATALNLEGLACQYLLQSERAVACFQRALAICVANPERAGAVRESVEQNLAVEHWRAMKVPQAVQELEAVYRRSVEARGEDDPSTLACGNNLAEAYRAHGMTEDAMRLSERLLAVWRRRGVSTPEALIRLHNHAHLLEQMDRHAEALAVEVEVVAHAAAVLGHEHPHGATALQSAGIFALGAGDYAAAEGHFAALLEHPAMAAATPRQRALRPLLHASAIVARGPEHYERARPLFAAHLADADVYEADAAVREFVLMARAAAARIDAATVPAAAARLRQLRADLADVAGEHGMITQLVTSWIGPETDRR